MNPDVLLSDRTSAAVEWGSEGQHGEEQEEGFVF